jgi:predicted 3-demethylubiquinone-9 3-methyltransferase (glyoxalase superfamily)
MQTTPFLMFTGDAEAAMNLYCAVIPNSSFEILERYPAGAGAALGAVKHAFFTLAGTRYRCTDSPIKHEFSFTPSFSIFLDADSRAQFDALVAALAVAAKVLMPPANYGFSTWFTWFEDRFGVSWQVNLA